MKIAITGSSGMIGSALSRSLRADGHTVVPVVRRPVAEGEEAVRWDPAAGTIDPRLLEGTDAVVNLAGAGIGDKRWSDDYKRLIVESRISSTDLIVRTMVELDQRPSVLVSGSAIGYYGDKGDAVVTEASPAGDDFLAETCVQWEAAATPAADAGIRVALVRTGIVLDASAGALQKLLPLFKLGLGGRMGSGRQWWSWITLDDEVRAIRHLLDNEVSGPVNLTAPDPVTNADFSGSLGSVLHRPSFLPVPSFGPKLVVGSELAEALLFTSARVLPEALTGSGFTFAEPDLEGALRQVLDRPAAA